MIDAGIQLSVIGVSLIILILVILGIIDAEFIKPDYLKLFLAYLLIAIVAIAVSSKGFERFINERIFKSIPAPYSAEVAKKLIYVEYMVLLITTTLHKLEDPSKLDFWNLVAMPSFANFVAWERFRS